MGIDYLDAVLDYMYYDRSFHKIEEVHEKALQGVEVVDLAIIIQRLIKDGNVTIEEITITSKKLGEPDGLSFRKTYFLSFDGLLFKEAGGYRGESARKNLEIENIKSEIEVRKRHERHLIYGTYTVGVGATLLVVWEIVKYFFLEDH